MNQFSIEPLAESHLEKLRFVLDSVARERKYLALVQAPPMDELQVFYQKLLKAACSHVALQDDELVGWCDIMRNTYETTAHLGLLGMGLLAHARHKGVGRQLLKTTIATAWQQGMTRIELNVRADNLNAKTLYEQFGFETEGYKRNVFLIDGQHHDCYFMALLKL